MLLFIDFVTEIYDDFYGATFQASSCFQKVRVVRAISARPMAAAYFAALRRNFSSSLSPRTMLRCVSWPGALLSRR